MLMIAFFNNTSSSKIRENINSNVCMLFNKAAASDPNSPSLSAFSANVSIIALKVWNTDLKAS